LTDHLRARRPAMVLRLVLAVLVVVPFISAAIIGVESGRKWRADRGVGALILLDAESQPRFKIERTLCWNADIVLQQAPLLRASSLSTFAGGMSAIPRQAMVYAAPPPVFRELLERRPADRAALQRLWDVYVVGSDLRRAFTVGSPSMATDLIRWAAEAARGQHYLSPQLAEFAVEYEGLRDELGRAAGKGP